MAVALAHPTSTASIFALILALLTLALTARAAAVEKPWCGPDVMELADHVCWSDGGTRVPGRRTLVVYLHGSLTLDPGFQYVQQRMMARQAKEHGFVVVIPTAPRTESGYWWPSGASQREHEPGIVATIARSREALEAQLGAKFDEVFVIGFSSGAYYASSLVVRGVLDVDGYIVLAGGSSWMRPDAASTHRVPVFVGVSASDKQTAEHSRGFAGTLAALRWPYRVEERDVGHSVDAGFIANGLGWLRRRLAAEPHPRP